MAARLPARLTPAEGRRFAFTVGAAFLVLAGLMWWRERASLRAVFGAAGALFVLAGALVPGRLGPVHGVWMGLAHALSKVTTPVFLAIVYFGLMLPIGLVMRLAGRRPLAHREVDGSFWKAPVSGGRSDLDHQF